MLKSEQEVAVGAPLEGRDVLAVSFYPWDMATVKASFTKCLFVPRNLHVCNEGFTLSNDS